MADNTTPTPFSLSWFASKDDLIAAQAARITELEAELEAVGAGGVQSLRSPLKTAEGVEPTKDDEERAFESWLERTCPSGDCEAMQRQWEGSADFKDLFTAPQPQVEPAVPALLIARALGEWHEDDGPVVWWAWCGHGWAGEAPFTGTPYDSD